MNSDKWMKRAFYFAAACWLASAAIEFGLTGNHYKALAGVGTAFWGIGLLFGRLQESR